MEKEFLVNQDQLTKEGYVIISSYFLDYCVEILGTGPGMLYIQLLNYCYKGKDLAWPTLDTLGKKMQFTPKSITKFHQILLKHGLIKKISKGKTASGSYKRNIYQITPLHMVKNALSTGNIFPQVEEKITPNPGKKLPTNNTNLNSTNTTTTTNKEKDAVAVVDFKKLKEKGGEKMQAPYSSKEHYTGQAIKERLRDLDFEGKFIEQILKEYSPKKIEEKLDLLMERRNIKSPAGWLSAALKNDYQDSQSPLSFPRKRESIKPDEEPAEQESQPLRINSRFRGNDIKGSGNDIKGSRNDIKGSRNDREDDGNDKCRGTMHRAHIIPNVIASLPKASEAISTPTVGQASRLSQDNKNILSSEEAARRFKLLRDKLKAMN